ncbi:MAG: FHA domain-containing protein [Bacteroidaceae bacterium]|nr:FHA domain-containing protein [Bacteroidaceae bacterium]
MEQQIHIKCPYCGVILKVNPQPGLGNAHITCPVCKRKSPFTDFARLEQKDPKETENTVRRAASGNDPTELPCNRNYTVGCVVERSGKAWQLRVGVNTIGRKLQTPPQQVDIPINDYTGERRMSRNHAKIEVIRLADGSVKHVLCNWQNKNRTYIAGEPLEADDRIVLHDGAVIRFANIDVRFSIEDSENTI